MCSCVWLNVWFMIRFDFFRLSFISMSKRTLTLNNYFSSSTGSGSTAHTNESRSQSNLIADPGQRKPIASYDPAIRNQLKRAYVIWPRHQARCHKLQVKLHPLKFHLHRHQPKSSMDRLHVVVQRSYNKRSTRYFVIFILILMGIIYYLCVVPWLYSGI